ncbi:MAG: TPM domain-containing protein [Sodaliphilus sp.]
MTHRLTYSIVVVLLASVLFVRCTSGKSPGADAAASGDSAEVVAGKLQFPAKPSMMVSDFAGVLTDSIRGLEDDLRRYASEVPMEIMVVTMADIGDADVWKMAHEMSVRWHLAEKERSVLILIVPKSANSSAQAAIVASEGISHIFSDTYCRGVVSDVMQPLLQDKNYYGAAVATVEDVLKTLSNVQQ